METVWYRPRQRIVTGIALVPPNVQASQNVYAAEWTSLQKVGSSVSRMFWKKRCKLYFSCVCIPIYAYTCNSSVLYL